jgi:hypothetical protein
MLQYDAMLAQRSQSLTTGQQGDVDTATEQSSSVKATDDSTADDEYLHADHRRGQAPRRPFKRHRPTGLR